MIRFLILGIIAWACFKLLGWLTKLWLLLKFKRVKEEAQRKLEPTSLRACEQCGVYVDEASGVKVKERFYCCKEHAKESE